MKKGFTLIEVMVSIVMLSLLVVAIFPVVGWLINRSAQYKYDSEAAEVLQEGMEASYNVVLATSNWDTLPVDQDLHIQEVVNGSPDQFAWTFDLGEATINAKYDRWLRIENVCRDSNTGNKLANCTNPGQIDANSKYLTTYVEWKEQSSTKTIKSELLIVKM